MRAFLTGAMLLALFLAVTPATADQTGDKAAVIKAEERFDAAVNAHDAKAAVATMVADSEDWEGLHKGKAAIEELLAGLFAGPMKNFHTKLLDVIGVDFVTPDVAIYKARYEITGVVDEEGKAAPAEKILFARVYVKKNGRWLGTAMFTRPIEE